MNSVKTPKVSIALATYNGSAFLPELLDSIFQQTYRDIEVVASDDCSTDTTVDILKEYQQNHRLSYSVNRERVGFLRNFDRAISMCNGEFIALADQDDIWHPNKIEILVKRIGTSSLICSDCSIVDERGERIADSYRKALQVPVPRDEDQYYGLAFLNYIMGCTVLFRKKLAEHALPIPDEALSHEWWLGICACRLGGVRYLPESLVSYRQHDANAVGGRALWTFHGIVRYIFSRERKEIFRKEERRIRYYIDHGVFNDGKQEAFLKELLDHFSSIVHSVIHVKAFLIIYKYRILLLHDLPLTARWKYLLGRLI